MSWHLDLTAKRGDNRRSLQPAEYKAGEEGVWHVGSIELIYLLEQNNSKKILDVVNM